MYKAAVMASEHGINARSEDMSSKKKEGKKGWRKEEEVKACGLGRSKDFWYESSRVLAGHRMKKRDY